MTVPDAEKGMEGKLDSSSSDETHNSSANGISDGLAEALGKVSADIQPAISIGIAEDSSDFMESVPLSRQLAVEFAGVSVWVPKMKLGNPNPLMKSTTLARTIISSVGKGGGDRGSNGNSDSRQVMK
jgi:hypothetical protein